MAVELLAIPAHAQLIGMAITYQGELLDDGTPVNDICDFEFTMWTSLAGGSMIGPVEAKTIDVIEGKFTTPLDFEDGAFNGDARWLEIDVCCPSPCSPSFTTLSPRQEVTAAPHAIRAVDGVGPPLALEVDQANNRIGIGTVSPTVPLDVSGVIRTFGGGSSLTLDGPQRQIRGGADETLRVYGNTTAANSRSWIELWGDDVARAGELALSGTYVSFRSNSTTSGSGTERARLDAAGNLGVGTTNPQSKLHVFGGSDASLGGGGYLTLGSISGANIAIDDNEIMARNNGAATTLHLNAEGGEALFFANGTGRVGIGTSTPEAMLHLVGGDDAILHIGDDPQLVLQREVAANKFRIYVAGTNYNGKHLQIGRDDQNHDIGLMGDVGVGTTAPGTKLHVVGGSDASLGGGGILTLGSTSGSNLVIDDNEIMARNNGAAVALSLNNEGGNVHLIATGTGNVGIGTNSPTEKLHVDGNARINGSITIPTTTRYYSIPPFAFMPADNESDYDHGTITNQRWLYTNVGAFDSDSPGSDQEFAAPVYLPHGAVITELFILLWDQDVHDFDVSLERTRLTTTNGIGVIATLGTTGFPGQVALSTTSISNGTVNNNEYSYTLWVRFPEAFSDVLSIGSARITYTITTPLP